MQGEFIQDLLVSGVPLLALLPIPAAAVFCAIALGFALLTRRFVLAVGSIATAVAVMVVAETLRDLSAVPTAVDAMVMQIPIALAIGALPALIRLIPATARVIRRHIRTIEADAGFGAPASVGVTATD